MKRSLFVYLASALLTVLLLANGTGNIWRAAGAALRDYQISSLKVAEEQLIYSLVADQQGTIWLGNSQGLSRYQDGELERFANGKELLAERVYDLFLDSQERLWLAYGPQLTGQSLAVSMYQNGDWRHFGGIESNTVFSFTEDQQGNIYAGGFFEQGGLFIFTGNQFQRLADFPQQIAINDLYTDKRGTIWMASTDSGIFSYNPVSKEQRQYATRLARIQLKQGFEEVPLPNNDIRSIGQGQDGKMWFGGEFEQSERQTAGLVSFDGANTWKSYNRNNSGLLDERIFAILPDPEAGVWFATASGVNYYSDGNWQAFKASDGLPAGAINDLLILSPYKIWLATEQGAWQLTNQNPQVVPLEVNDLRASVGDGAVVLSWLPVINPEAVGYVVLQSLDQGKNFTERTFLNDPDDYFVNLSNLTNDAIYIFKVLTRVKGGRLSQGVAVTAIPQEKTIALPLAHAGKDQVTVVGVETMLAGNQSQYFTNSASYRWTLEDGPVRAVQFDSTDIVHPRFIPQVPGRYVFSLLITDAKGQKSIQNELSRVVVQVKLASELKQPIVRLKEKEIKVEKGQKVVMDASESIFSTTTASFQWKLLAGPIPKVAWDLIDVAKPSFITHVVGVYLFELMITDAAGHQSEPAEVTVLVSEPETYTLFKDLPDSHWSRDYFSTLKGQKIITGYEDDTVKPFQSISRVEFLKLAFAAIGLKLDENNKESIYRDVTDQNIWYFPYVMTAAKAGIIGSGDGKFHPDQSITRAEALKILLLAANLTEGNRAKLDFADVAADAWYQPYIGRAVNLALIKGFEDNTFKPNQTITRSEAAKIIVLLGQKLSAN